MFATILMIIALMAMIGFGRAAYRMLNDKQLVVVPPPQMYEDGRPGSRILLLEIAGINYRNDMQLYTGRLEVSLIPEPNNAHDPDAIKVIAAEDGHHLGYIAQDDTARVRAATHNRLPRNAIAHIEGRLQDFTHKPIYQGQITLHY